MHQPKNKATLANGRSATKDFGNSFSKSFTVGIMTSLAYRHLAPAAKDVCNLMFVKNDNARFHKQKDADGKPVFTFTTADAVSFLKISNKTFSNSLKQLDAHGLIERHKRGGLIGANGVASEFTLSNRWKDWLPEGKHIGHANINKARAAPKRKPIVPG